MLLEALLHWIKRLSFIKCSSIQPNLSNRTWRNRFLDWSKDEKNQSVIAFVIRWEYFDCCAPNRLNYSKWHKLCHQRRRRLRKEQHEEEKVSLHLFWFFATDPSDERSLEFRIKSGIACRLLTDNVGFLWTPSVTFKIFAKDGHFPSPFSLFLLLQLTIRLDCNN